MEAPYVVKLYFAPGVILSVEHKMIYQVVITRAYPRKRKPGLELRPKIFLSTIFLSKIPIFCWPLVFLTVKSPTGQFANTPTPKHDRYGACNKYKIVVVNFLAVCQVPTQVGLLLTARPAGAAREMNVPVTVWETIVLVLEKLFLWRQVPVQVLISLSVISRWHARIDLFTTPRDSLTAVVLPKCKFVRNIAKLK